MKKIAFVALLLLLRIPTYAQGGVWEIDAGVSYFGMDREFAVSEINSSTKNPSTILPTFSLRGGYYFPESFVGLFLDISFSYARSVYQGGPSPLVEEEPIFHVTPQLRLYYKNSPKLRMYASLGGGLRVRQFSETFEGDTIRKTFFDFSWMASPFGISLGQHWNASLELGVGWAWSIGRFCVGYRF